MFPVLVDGVDIALDQVGNVSFLKSAFLNATTKDHNRLRLADGSIQARRFLRSWSGIQKRVGLFSGHFLPPPSRARALTMVYSSFSENPNLGVPTLTTSIIAFNPSSSSRTRAWRSENA